MAVEEERIDYIPEELEDDFSNDDLFNISSWGADITLREIVTSYQEGDFVKPELQRKFVWDKKEASRFIESILLGLPVPSIFLAQVSKGPQLIVDGYQRIMTIVDFYEGVWKKDNTPFKLWNSERINERWRNKSYGELSEDDKRRFRLYTIHAIIFEQKKPRNDDGLFQIFERINTSGKVLNAQEIRNCVSQGSMNSLLFKLNKNEKWRVLFGDENEDSRMLDLEFILRFFTLSQDKILKSKKYTISLKKELNEYMNKYRKADDAFIDTCTSDFETTIDFIYSHFGISAFYNLQNDLEHLRNKFYPTVFDSLMIATKIALNNGYEHEGSLEQKRLELLRDPDYRESITQGTMQIEHIKTRVNKALEVIYGMNLGNE
ncbi:MAG: DUF262 domain-containing protein [Bacteroidales bacterium]|jgi:uncharacterized protein with ParB-like and HNH nuclease domain|nr:DUF262 domain-containing protein [Bacteroidales bacterium]